MAFLLYSGFRYLGTDPWEVYHGPGHPPPSTEWYKKRYRYFQLAMAAYARDEQLRVHGVHPDQQEAEARERSKGVRVQMPGGKVGYKPTGR